MQTTEDPAGPVLVEPEVRRKRGRPASKVIPELLPSQEQNLEPPPPSAEPDHSRVPSCPKKLLPPDEFFRYWKSVPKVERDAWFIAYVYRKFPICDVLQPLSVEELRAIERHQKKRPDTNCGKFTEPLDPDNWELQVYERWGAGDYQIRLNDQHPSVKSTVCETHIKGLRDWNNFRPVLNLAEVVLEEPLNQPYIRWARLAGIQFPGDPGSEATISNQEQEDEMANVAAVEKLTDALVDATRNRPQPVQMSPAPADVGAVAKAVETLTAGFSAAASRQQEIILDGVKTVQQMQTRTQDPGEYHKNVLEAARAMQPPVSTGPNLTELVGMFSTLMGPVIESNKAVLAMMQARAESAERRSEALEQRLYQQQAAPAAAPSAVSAEVSNPVKNAIDLIKGLVSLKDQAGSLLGDTADADMPVWAKVASKVIDVAPGMLYNAAVMKSGQGQPVPPELNPELVQHETQPEPAAQVAAPEETMTQNQRIAREISAPLINALNEGRKGFEFAAGMILTPKIMGFPGRVVYEMAVAEGPDGMYKILQSYPELWAKLTLIPTQFAAFLAEFLDRKMAYGVAEQAQNPQPQEPVPPARSVDLEVLPPEKPKRTVGGRTIINPADGKPVHTGPVVNEETV